MNFAGPPRKHNRSGQRGKQLCKVLFERESIGKGGSDERIEHRAGTSPFHRRGEEPVLPPDCERTDRVLRPVDRGRNIPVLQDTAQIWYHKPPEKSAKPLKTKAERGSKFRETYWFFWGGSPWAAQFRILPVASGSPAESVVLPLSSSEVSGMLRYPDSCTTAGNRRLPPEIGFTNSEELASQSLTAIL